MAMDLGKQSLTYVQVAAKGWSEAASHAGSLPRGGPHEQGTFEFLAGNISRVAAAIVRDTDPLVVTQAEKLHRLLAGVAFHAGTRDSAGAVKAPDLARAGSDAGEAAVEATRLLQSTA